ncbi:MAG: P-II family nitrogen regulator [Gemmatimonadota bacterium]
MKEIKAYLRPHMVDAVVDALEARPHTPGLTVTDVTGFGHVRGEEATRLVERVKLEIVVADDQVEEVVATIVEKARTGTRGDGKIFVSEVADAVRIRTGERGDRAIAPPEE